MSILSSIFKKETTALVDSAGRIVDDVITSKEEAAELKNKLSTTIFDSFLKVVNIQKEIILADSTGNWLQRGWRPIVMLIFAGLIVTYWFGWATPDKELAMKILDIVQLGLGGMVIGRTVEKVASNVTKNIDLDKLRRKDRTEHYNN